MGPDIAGLSEAEKQHPFWRTGLGAAAARRQVSMGIEPFVLTHCSLLTAHCSLPTAHCSPFTRASPRPPRRAVRRVAT